MSSVGYKPSPLGYGSPRSSPFRRPVSPLPPSPSPAAPSPPLANRQQEQQQTTPTPSPTKAAGAGGRSSSSLFTPSRFVSNNNNSPSATTPTTSLTPTAQTHSENRTPRRLFVPPAADATKAMTSTTTSSQQPLGSPAHISSSRASTATGTTMYPQQYNNKNTSSNSIKNNNISLGHNNDLSRLQPTQVRMLRDGFQIMDRDSDGVVNRQDVADMLTQLGAYKSCGHWA